MNHSLDSLDISSNCNHGYNSSFIHSNHFGSVGKQILILDRKKMEKIQLEIHCLFHGSDRGFKQSFHVDIFETIPLVLDGKPIRENVWDKTKRKLIQTLTNYYEPSFRVIGIDGNSFSGSRNHHSGNYGSVGRKNSGVGGTFSGDSYYLLVIYAMNEKGSSDRNESFTVLVSDDPDRYTTGDNVYNHLFHLESEERRGAGNRIQSPSPISSSSSSSGGGKSSSSSTKSFPSSSSGSSQGETSFSLFHFFTYHSVSFFLPVLSVELPFRSPSPLSPSPSSTLVLNAFPITDHHRKQFDDLTAKNQTYRYSEVRVELTAWTAEREREREGEGEKENEGDS